MKNLSGRQIGPYDLLDRIGQAGSGVVYRAVHRALGQPRAVKIFWPYLELDDSSQRFWQAVTAGAGLQHPNIVRIYNVGEQDGLRYVVMQLVEGQSLRALVQAHGVMPVRRAVRLLAQIAEALDYAHGRGVAHRDLKPENVLVGADDHITVTDFALGRVLRHADTRTAGAIVSVPEWAAPEAATIDGGMQAADLYAFGLMAHELLTGALPNVANAGAATGRVGRADLVSPRALRPSLPAAMERALLRQLDEDPGARFASAGSFAAVLSAAARLGIPHSVTPPGGTAVRAASGRPTHHPGHRPWSGDGDKP